MILPFAPPQALLDRLAQAGMVVDLRNTIFTYGENIYNPTGQPLPNHLIEHESVHVRQQTQMEGGPDAWWDRYLKDKKFRIEQEAEAYGHQYAFFCTQKSNRRKQMEFLVALGHMLAGSTYGGIIDVEEATRLIQRTAQN